jgi:D-alanyl-D-alanine carboxypeptidase/D-alanyl-D-alanine-endopeptidase (penicillin-binding protein 4)
MKKTLCAILTVLLAFNGLLTANAQMRPLFKKNHTVNKTIKEVNANAGFITAGLAFYAIDLKTGEVISEYNSDMVLKPASTLKLLTTATALELLSPEFKFKTILQYTGAIDTVRHVLNGNIYILGGGDPSLGSMYFASTKDGQFLEHWLSAIKQMGIDSITGNIIGDARIYDLDIVPSTWSWQNMGNYFGAGACGLSVYDNYYTLHFKTGNKYGDSTHVECVNPQIKGLSIENAVWSDSIAYDNTNIFGAPYCYQRFIRGTLPLQKDDFIVKGSTPDPALLTAQELYRTLIGNAVKVGGKASTCRLMKKAGKKIQNERVAFDTLFSPQLDSIVTQTNVHSINLFAEHCLMQSALQLGTCANVDSAVKTIETYWEQKGMDIHGLSLNDGSGLSHYNLINPKQMVFLLQYMKKQSVNFNAFYNSMALVGDSGTLKQLCKNTLAQGNMRAKSGTISRVKAYAGYVTSESGREIAFSMVVNNYSSSTWEATVQLEKLMISLAEFDK